eukprot:Colp12_sorted_trinity150504_noHs@12077
MVRSRGANSATRKAFVFALTKGYRGRSKNCFRLAKNRLEKALQYQYASRRLKKRDMRSLWINRINAGSREHGVPYSRFMHGLVLNNVALNRKVLAQLAIHEPRSFKGLAELCKTRVSNGLLDLLPK